MRLPAVGSHRSYGGGPGNASWYQSIRYGGECGVTLRGEDALAAGKDFKAMSCSNFSPGLIA